MSKHGADALTVAAIVAARDDIARIEAEYVRDPLVVQVERTRPIVAVRSNVVELAGGRGTHVRGRPFGAGGEAKIHPLMAIHCASG